MLILFQDIETSEGNQAWIIGIVEKGDRSARIIDKPRIIEVGTIQYTVHIDRSARIIDKPRIIKVGTLQYIIHNKQFTVHPG